jgi:hypothetical protein
MNPLSEALRLYCAAHKISIRQAAGYWQTSPATASRFLNGGSVEQATFINILKWATEEDA